MLGWICEGCGYKNEYSDLIKTTECLCCGDSATEEQIKAVEQELYNYLQEAERERIREKVNKKINIFTGAFKLVSTSLCLVLVVCGLLVIYEIITEAKVSGSVSNSGYMQNFVANTGYLGVFNKLTSPLISMGRHILITIEEHFTQMIHNLT